MSRIIRRARTGDLTALVPLVEQYLGFYNVKHPRATVSRFISQKLRAKPVLVWVGSRARGTALGPTRLRLMDGAVSGAGSVAHGTSMTSTSKESESSRN